MKFNLQTTRIVFGLLVWGAVVAIVASVIYSKTTESSKNSTNSLIKYSVNSRQVVSLSIEESEFSESVMWIGIGDPVFVQDGDDFTRVGEVRDFVLKFKSPKPTLGWAEDVDVLFYATAPELSDAFILEYHETPISLPWVVETMLTDEMKLTVQNELTSTFNKNRDKLLQEFEPIIESTFNDIAVIAREDFQVAFQKRRARIKKITDRYQVELVQEKFFPLVQKEIWPIVRERAIPTAERAGNQIWKKASVWRFGWRIAYDKLPLPQRNLARQEFDRFVRDEAQPVLKQYVPEFIELQKQIFKEISENREIKLAIEESIDEISHDPEIRAVTREIVEEIFVNNPRINEVLLKNWSSPQAQRALFNAGKIFEPSVVKIAEGLFGTPETQITPEFARVLRNQVLRKDNRWFVLKKREAPDKKLPTTKGMRTMDVVVGKTGSENPFVLQKLIPNAKK